MHRRDVHRMLVVLRAVALFGIALWGGASEGCAAPPEWTVDRDEPEAAFLSVVAHAGEVFAVGADAGRGALFLRRSGDAWRRIDTAGRGTLWWLTPEPDGALLAVGEAGRIVRFDPATERFTAAPSGVDDTLFGAWVAPDGTAWAVGGDVLAESDRGVLLVRRDGRWTPDERVPEEALSGAVLFKVWGARADDVWAVGERGTVLRFDGDAWRRVDAPSSTRLLTIHGGARGEAPIAVGGTANGVLLEWDGAAFRDRMPELLPGANGVFVDDDGDAFAVGNRGLVLSSEGASWLVRADVPTERDLHAVAIDDDGVVWAVGGALLSPALDHGVVLRLGPP